jgi:hypothetical protein
MWEWRYSSTILDLRKIPIMALCTPGFIMDQYGWKVNKIAAITVEQFMVYVEIPFIALCKLDFIMAKYGWKLELPNSESPTLNISKICWTFYTIRRNVHLCPENQSLWISMAENQNCQTF